MSKLLRPQDSFPKESWIEYANELEKVVIAWGMHRPRGDNISAGVGIFLDDQTGEERSRLEIDTMQAEIDDIAAKHGFSVNQVGSFHAFARFFGRIYLDEVRWAIEHGDDVAQRTHTRAEEMLDDIKLLKPDEIKLLKRLLMD